MNDATKILTRHPDNPLISPEDIPGVLKVFNPSPVMYENQTILLVSIVAYKNERNGETRIARSDDGVHFTVDEYPFINLDITNRMILFIDISLTIG
jgi:predicted GH43/DUF377 family glycosyl hydrolase